MFVCLFRDMIGPIFTNNERVIKYVASLVPFMVALQIGDGIQACANVLKLF